MTETTSRVRRVLINLTLLAGSLVLMCVFAEVVLRLLPGTAPAMGQGTFCKDPILRMIMTPGVRSSQHGEWGSVICSANQQGYRDVEWPAKNARPRVMLLGDSFGWGWGCSFDKTIGPLMERNAGAAIFNLSMPGDGIDDYYARYSVHHPVIKPDAVLLLMYVNDFFEETTAWDPRTLAAAKVDPNVPYALQCSDYARPLMDYVRRSHLFLTLDRLRVSSGLSFSSGARRRRLLKAGYRGDLHFLRGNPSKVDPGFWRLEQLLQVFQRDRMPVIIAYIPPFYTIDEGAKREIQEVSEEPVHTEWVETRMAELCARLAVPFVNLAAALRTPGPAKYYRHDSHLTELGHAIAAEALREPLKNLLSASGRAGTR